MSLLIKRRKERVKHNKMKANLKSLIFSFILIGSFAFLATSACNQTAKAKPSFVHKLPPRSGVVAKIGGQEITEEALVGDGKMDFFNIKKQEYDLKVDRINKLMVDILVGNEAKTAKMPLEEFINKKIVKGEIKITDKEYDKFVVDRHIPQNQLNPQIKEKIINYLQTSKRQEMIQAYIGQLTAKSPVELYFDKPKMQVNVDFGKGPMMGGEKASVAIVEFSDFQCPYCARAADTIGEVKKKYGNKVKITFRHFPLPNHKEARPASEASMCINEQSSQKFWKFHDLLFKNQDKMDTANLEKYAKDVGADTKKFKECFDSKKFASFVQSDLEYGEKIGVRSTPTFFINGQLMSGALPIEQFSDVIDDELAAAKK